MDKSSAGMWHNPLQQEWAALISVPVLMTSPPGGGIGTAGRLGLSEIHLYFRKGCRDSGCYLKLCRFQQRHRDEKDKIAASFWIHISPSHFLSLFSPISTLFTTLWSAIHSPSLHNCCSKSVIVLPAMNSAYCNLQEAISTLQDCSMWGGRDQMRTWLSTKCCAFVYSNAIVGGEQRQQERHQLHHPLGQEKTTSFLDS